METKNEYEYERKRKGDGKKRKIIEDDIAEYLIKKYRKAAKKIKSCYVSRYPNESNPFNDSNINEKLVWEKKIERDVVEEGFSPTRPANSHLPLKIMYSVKANTNSHLPLKIMFSVKEEKMKERQRMEEIEKVKKRREEKAVKKAEREERMALMARVRALAEIREWEKKEQEFCFEQIKARAEIRLREGRVKPIDVLSMHLDDPCLLVESLEVKDMEKLREDIKLHLDLDRATPSRIRYWEALLVVCDWELAEARKKEALNRARVRGQQPPAELLAEQSGLHSSTEAEVKNLLQVKSHSELQDLQTAIESQSSGTADEVEYWESVLKCIYIFKAKAFLEEYHVKMLDQHLEKDHGTGYDRNKDQPLYSEPESYEETGEAGAYSPELFHGEETEDVIDPE